MVKELTVFTKGNSSDIKSWSNVPYLFTRELESRGIVVNRVNISPTKSLKWIYDRTMLRILRLLYPKTDFSYTRGLIHFLDVKRKIKSSLGQFEQADANIFFTFGFSSAGLTKKPTILFYDIPYQYSFYYNLNRDPDFLERKCIKRETLQIERADLVVTLFQSALEFMRVRYHNTNIRYISNVINAIEVPDKNEILPQKISSQYLLFIGKKKYVEGVKRAINAYSKLKKRFPELRLEIIGMNADAVEDPPKGVRFHGYLDKGDENQRDLYYSLLKGAKALVLASDKWGGISAVLEALHFYVPVVTPSYKEFVLTFGDEIDFGYYFENGSLEALCRQISNVLEHKAYEILCLNAHNAVKGHTWRAFTEQLLDQIDKLAAQRRRIT